LTRGSSRPRAKPWPGGARRALDPRVKPEDDGGAGSDGGIEEGSASCRARKRPLAASEGPLIVSAVRTSVRGQLRSLFGQDGQAFAVDVGEAALDLEAAALGAVIDRHHAFAQRGHEGRVARQDAEVALEIGRAHV